MLHAFGARQARAWQVCRALATCSANPFLPLHDSSKPIDNSEVNVHVYWLSNLDYSS
jgi:hypothetical protein